MGPASPMPLVPASPPRTLFSLPGHGSRKSTGLGIRETRFKSPFCHKWLYGLRKFYQFSGLKNEGVGLDCLVIFPSHPITLLRWLSKRATDLLAPER